MIDLWGHMKVVCVQYSGWIVVMHHQPTMWNTSVNPERPSMNTANMYVLFRGIAPKFFQRDEFMTILVVSNFIVTSTAVLSMCRKVLTTKMQTSGSRRGSRRVSPEVDLVQTLATTITSKYVAGKVATHEYRITRASVVPYMNLSWSVGHLWLNVLVFEHFEILRWQLTTAYISITDPTISISWSVVRWWYCKECNTVILWVTFLSWSSVSASADLLLLASLIVEPACINKDRLDVQILSLFSFGIFWFECCKSIPFVIFAVWNPSRNTSDSFNLCTPAP